MSAMQEHSNPLVAGLLASRAFPDAPSSVELVETHISYIFLTGKYAYKVRKAVDFGFLDFSTLEKRLQDCHREVELNRRLSPEVYLGVVEVRREGDRYSVEGPGDTVEYAVRMRQLPGERAMSELLRRGEVTGDTVRRVARKIAAFHLKAEGGERIARLSGYPAVRQNIMENFSQTERYIGRTIPLEEYLELKAYSAAFLEARRPLLEERARQGWMRDCHGDLHSAQIFIEDGIHIIDCIEFNERFRYCDTAADIAFLAMDLDYHDRRDLSRALIEAYQEEMKDPGLAHLLDFYKVYRAYVRGKVAGFRLDTPDLAEKDREGVSEEAGRYFRLARSYLRPMSGPTLFVVMGLTGTGKTQLATSLARLWELTHISTDRVRKALAGVPATEHRYADYDSDIYSPGFTRETYREMHREAEGLLAQRKSVVLDGTYKDASFREEAFSVARRSGASVVPVLCVLPQRVARERLEGRMREPGAVSDGRWEVYLRQREEFEPLKEEHLVVDTSGTADESLFRALKKIYELGLKEEVIG